MIRYVYVIVNRINGKMYIGSTRGLKPRLAAHFYVARKKKSFSKFSNAIRKYGSQNFEMKVLESFDCGAREIRERESFFINFFQTCKQGYNTSSDTFAGLYDISEETRKKLSQSSLKNWQSSEFRGKVSLGHKNSKPRKYPAQRNDSHLKESRAVLLASRNKSPEHIQKVSLALKGRKRAVPNPTRKLYLDVVSGEIKTKSEWLVVLGVSNPTFYKFVLRNDGKFKNGIHLKESL